MPIPSLDLDFQCHMSCFFVFSELMCDVTARFVDIGGIVYHLCLNLIFIILLIICMSYTTMIFNIIERFVYGV